MIWTSKWLILSLLSKSKIDVDHQTVHYVVFLSIVKGITDGEYVNFSTQILY
jgi:hypothetical protein